MGLFDAWWGPEAKLLKARKLLEQGRFMEVKERLDGLAGPEVGDLLARADRGLCELNLTEAQGCLRAGEVERANEHMALAQSFGATEEDLRNVRRLGRELRQEHQKEAADAAAVVRANAPPPPSEGDDPLWNLPPDDPRVRYAMLLEGYPPELRNRLLALGTPLAEAVLQIDEGAPHVAYERLGALVSEDAVVHYERARAALAAGQLPAAAGELDAFDAKVGHTEVGAIHTGVMHAQVLGQIGRHDDGLVLTRRLLGTSKRGDLKMTHAALLEAAGDLEGAENELVQVAKTSGPNLGLYRSIARVRVRRGNRPGAAQALEAGFANCCSSPGKCGNQKPDPHNLRMLAQILLEDRQNPDRAEEVLVQLSALGEKPVWEDRYLMALAARNRNDPETPRLKAQLERELEPADPRRNLVAQAFAVSIG